MHNTPDGLFCWAGRLERARKILANEADQEQAKVKLQKMESMQRDAYALAESTYTLYQRECVAVGKVPQEAISDCTCPACKREITFRICAALRKSELVDGKYGGLIVDEADQFQKDADRLGIAVEWQHFDLNTGEIMEGRGV